MKNQKQIIIFITVIAFVIGMIFCYDLFISKVNNEKISDEDCIKITDQTIEAQKFLEKYPDAKVYVDRSGSLAVDYRVDKYKTNDTTQSEKSIRLRIFIDSKNNKPSDKFIDCSKTIIRNDLIEYIKTEKCLFD